jgi:DNA-binding protein Fis
LFSRFKALRIVSNNFAVPLEFNLFLNVVKTPLRDIISHFDQNLSLIALTVVLGRSTLQKKKYRVNKLTEFA